VKSRVLLDCDGVLSDFVGGFLSVVNRICSSAFTPEHITEFDICKSLGVTPEQAAEAFRAVSETRGFALGLQPLPGAIEGVRQLREIADVYIVTSPWNSNPTWTHEREAWLKEHFDIPHSHVIHTSAKHLVVGDVLVDDKTSTLVAWEAAHPRGVAIQWLTPHNRRDEWSGWTTRSWDCVARRVKETP
jgi:5'(3')-deoxyribonucleotidase